MKRITIIEGHPDPSGNHLGNALATAYAEGAGKGGHQVERLTIATME